jgi:uncharacterized protein (TIGR00645 family)
VGKGRPEAGQFGEAVSGETNFHRENIRWPLPTAKLDIDWRFAHCGGSMDLENKVVRNLEKGLFAARWLLAPIYLGLIFCLVMLVVILVKYTIIVARQLLVINVHDAIVATLSFIDLALIANLVLIVLFTGYVSFVSKLNIDDHEDKPSWLGKVDFSGLKLKLFASIVAITGIELLKAFMDLRETGVVNAQALRWLVIIHVAFLVTTVASALTHKWEAGSP